MHVSVLPSISPCLIPTPTVRDRRQGAVVTGGARPGSCDHSQARVSLSTSVTWGSGLSVALHLAYLARIDGSLCKTALIRIERVCKPREGQTRKLSAVSSSPVIAEKWNPETKVISAF